MAFPPHQNLPTGAPSGFNPPSKGTTGKVSTASSPGLLTSTGGLIGNSGFLITPVYNTIINKPFISVIDPTNFDCEEDAVYYFRQEANYGQFPGEGREASFHRIILKYREIGKAFFNVNLTVYHKISDTFETISIPVTVPPISLLVSKRINFPDFKIHTIKLTPPKGVITGERPQLWLSRKANSGPHSVTKLVLCGNADTTSEQ